VCNKEPAAATQADCTDATCGPINGCSVSINCPSEEEKNSTDVDYFCFKCWGNVLKNNKKHIKAVRVGGITSKVMFTCPIPLLKLKGVV
jgi:hypothetical protein